MASSWGEFIAGVLVGQFLYWDVLKPVWQRLYGSR